MDAVTTLKLMNDTAKKVSFDDVSHTYFFKGRSLDGVTSTISTHFPKFDKNGEVSQKISEQSGKSVKQVKEEWRKSAEFGTAVHNFAERLILSVYFAPYGHNCDIYSQVSEETYPYCQAVERFLKEYEDPLGSFIAAVEYPVFSSKYSIAGTIDFVLMHPDGSVSLGDWKTNSSICPEGVNYGKFGFGQLAHIPDTNFYKYALQLSTYQKLFEEMHITVRNRFLVHISPTKYEEKGGYKKIDLPYLHDEVGIILRGVWE